MKLEQLVCNKRKITMNIFISEQHHISEAYNALRANLQFCGDDLRTIAFVSCMPEEGTSSVIWKLALSLAEIGKNVLVINANMQKNGMTDKYQLDMSRKGLSEYLSDRCQLEECIFQTSYKNLFILPCGAQQGNSSGLLSNHKINILVEETREAFDYVFMDCPALSNTIDGVLAAKMCDASVIVLEADKTKRRLAQSVKAQLEKADCRILGVILNKFNFRRFKCYGNYFGKSYGRKSD